MYDVIDQMVFLLVSFMYPKLVNRALYIKDTGGFHKLNTELCVLFLLTYIENNVLCKCMK